MFSQPGRAKIGTNPSEIENWAKTRHKLVMLSALQLQYTLATDMYKTLQNTKLIVLLVSHYRSLSTTQMHPPFYVCPLTPNMWKEYNKTWFSSQPGYTCTTRL